MAPPFFFCLQLLELHAWELLSFSVPLVYWSYNFQMENQQRQQVIKLIFFQLGLDEVVCHLQPLVGSWELLQHSLSSMGYLCQSTDMVRSEKRLVEKFSWFQK